MKIFISTPINARREKTFEEKREAALRRCGRLQVLIEGEWGKGTETVTPFDAVPIGEQVEEAEAIGRCTTALLHCDAVYLDHGWNGSKGCRHEYYVAKIYGLKIIEHDKV